MLSPAGRIWPRCMFYRRATPAATVWPRRGTVARPRRVGWLSGQPVSRGAYKNRQSREISFGHHHHYVVLLRIKDLFPSDNVPDMLHRSKIDRIPQVSSNPAANNSLYFIHLSQHIPHLFSFFKEAPHYTLLSQLTF